MLYIKISTTHSSHLHLHLKLISAGKTQLQNYYNLIALHFHSNCSHPIKFPRVILNLFAHKLIEAAFLDYARLLRSLCLREGAALWASRAGSAGQQLMEELFRGEGGAPEAALGAEEVERSQESTE